jgi:hypothetical protein
LKNDDLARTLTKGSRHALELQNGSERSAGDGLFHLHHS